MKLVHDDKKKKIITNQEKIEFSSLSSYHLIVITARTKGEKQLGGFSTDDEDLTVQIDGKNFPKLSNNNDLIDSPAAFSGGRLHNLAKTVYFITYLQGKDHKLILNADNPPGTATFEKLEIYTLDSADRLILEPKIQAEDGDRRSWITFVFDNLPLQSVTSTVTYSRRVRDSDDVKIIIDGKIQDNILRNIKHFLWRFVGSLLSKDSSLTEAETFAVNFSSGLHYIEFWADRMPVLNKLNINFGQVIKPPPRKPTENDPEWTGNFDDDTEKILLARLILGEAERQPKQVKIGIGFTVLNRLKKRNPNWGYSVREIILKDNQYDGMWNEYTYQKARDPLSDVSETRRKEWQESYEVAVGVLSGVLSDTTNGATNFHSFKKPKDFPVWATKETYKIKLGDIYFYELES